MVLLNKASVLMASAFAASAIYQYIVYEYTASDAKPAHDDWHKPLLLGTSIAGVALALWHAGTLLSARKNGDAIVTLVCAAPAFVLLSYLVQQNNMPGVVTTGDWRAKMVHFYSGFCLIIMAVSLGSGVLSFVRSKI